MPEDARGALASLLDVASRLGRLLPRAGRALRRLPEFLHALKLTALPGAAERLQVGARGALGCAGRGPACPLTSEVGTPACPGVGTPGSGISTRETPGACRARARESGPSHTFGRCFRASR